MIHISGTLFRKVVRNFINSNYWADESLKKTGSVTIMDAQTQIRNVVLWKWSSKKTIKIKKIKYFCIKKTAGKGLFT